MKTFLCDGCKKTQTTDKRNANKFFALIADGEDLFGGRLLYLCVDCAAKHYHDGMAILDKSSVKKLARYYGGLKNIPGKMPRKNYRDELLSKYHSAKTVRYDWTLEKWLDHIENGSLCHADVMRLVAEVDRLSKREKRDCAAILELREKLRAANRLITELEQQRGYPE